LHRGTTAGRSIGTTYPPYLPACSLTFVHYQAAILTRVQWEVDWPEGWRYAVNVTGGKSRSGSARLLYRDLRRKASVLAFEDKAQKCESSRGLRAIYSASKTRSFGGCLLHGGTLGLNLAYQDGPSSLRASSYHGFKSALINCIRAQSSRSHEGVRIGAELGVSCFLINKRPLISTTKARSSARGQLSSTSDAGPYESSSMQCGDGRLVPSRPDPGILVSPFR